MTTIVKKAEEQTTRIPFSRSHIFKTVFIVLLSSLWAQICSAQFIPYSQYYNTPLLTNPAQAGQNDFTQFSIHYRRSRVAQYEIPSISFVRPFYRGSDGLRAGGIGVNLVSQKAGPGGAYQVMGVLGTFAYNIHLSKTQYISAGLQGGVINKKLDPSGLTTDNQYNFGAFDPSLPNGENIQFSAVTKPIINSGFCWTMTDNSNLSKAKLGVACSNMNKPSYSLISGSDVEALTYTITGEMMLLQNGLTSVHPTFRYISGANSFANIGAQLRYRLATKNSDINVGGWYKTTKGIVAAIQYSNNTYTLAASMDFSAGRDMQANIHNAIELSFGWRLKRKVKLKRVESTSVVVDSPQMTPSHEPVTEPLQEQQPLKEEPKQVEVQSIIPVEDTTTLLKTEVDEITPEENSVVETNIAFSLGSSELTAESILFIETKLVSILKGHPNYRLHITGHSCTVGDKAINSTISLHRAQAIGKILVQHGVPEKQIIATGMDFQKPIASNDTEAGRQKNRRVEFELIKE